MPKLTFGMVLGWILILVGWISFSLVTFGISPIYALATVVLGLQIFTFAAIRSIYKTNLAD